MSTPLPTLPGVYYGRVTAHYLGLPTGNIFTFKSDAAPVDITQDKDFADVIATALAHQWNLTVGRLLPVDVHGWDSKVYPLGHATLPASVSHSDGTGGTTGQVAAVSTAAVIKNAVLRRGRGSQSHSLISPLSRTYMTDDGTALTGAHQTDLTNAFQAFLAAVEADFTAAFPTHSISYVQLSKKGTGATYTITSSVSEALLGTARARTPRP